ncbi:MAG TPA: FAD-dependent oxidoreductase [Acidimicrobiales bacterium]|nr:FAD-dependent oxidoreductase [Acidimicrobiales bacterium]
MGERLVVIGGDAGGMAAAAQARRRQGDLEIVALEMGRWTSYSACGIPYLVGGGVDRIEELVVRTPEQFRAMRIDVRIEHEATAVDLDARTVEVHNRTHDRTFKLGFDLLHVATGATPRRPDVPGIDGPHVLGVQTLGDAANLLDEAASRRPAHVCVVGSGYIGLELAEAFRDRGASVVVVEQGPEVMSSLDPDMGAMVSRAMRSEGITVRLGERLEAIEDGMVTTSGAEIAADLVVLGTGVAPDTGLAQSAGLATGPTGGLVVDRRQRTSADGVYAAGDCCESRHIVSGTAVHVPLGTHANKQGRVAGINMSGGYATFPGVAGTAVTRICACEVARTGLSEAEATAAGFEYTAARIESSTQAGYLHDSSAVTVKLLAEVVSGRVLGAQIVGGPGSAKRIDVVATALAAGMTAEEMVHLDLGYAPPFSPVWDPVIVAARQALSQLR